MINGIDTKEKFIEWYKRQGEVYRRLTTGVGYAGQFETRGATLLYFEPDWVVLTLKESNIYQGNRGPYRILHLHPRSVQLVEARSQRTHPSQRRRGLDLPKGTFHCWKCYEQPPVGVLSVVKFAGAIRR